MVFRFSPIQNLSWHAGMRLVGVGVLVAGFALALPRIPALAGRFSANGLDFARGLCFGLAVTFAVCGVAAMVVKRKPSGS
jgi:hypothetical protein